MKIRKLLALILAILTLASLIAACGETAVEEKTSEAVAQNSDDQNEETEDPTKDAGGY